MQSTYYTTDVTKATYVELWRTSGSWSMFLRNAIFKLFRVSSAGKNLAVNPNEFRHVPWNELADRAADALQQRRGEMEALGYRHEFCQICPRVGNLAAVRMVMLAADGSCFVTVDYETHDINGTINEIVSTAVTSQLSDGETIITCNRRDLPGPSFHVRNNPHKSPTQLVEWHQKRLRTSIAQPVLVQSGFDVQDKVARMSQEVFEYLAACGVMVPVSAGEAETMKPSAVSNETARQAIQTAPSDTTPQIEFEQGSFVASDVDAEQGRGAPSRHPEIMAALERVQSRQRDWLSGATVLGISIVFFVGLGAAQWEWTFVGLLIPVLLFHESGHLIAMRAFKYRNLKMFFIPLVGAAVTGRNYNVAGWKKAVVSLAGPVPGIFLGCALGATAMAIGEQELLMQAAILMIVLNAFNLLPFLPLDGGWVLHAVLFSRHPLLDVLFRFVAAITLIGAGLLGMWMFLLLGIFMLVSMRMSYQIVKIAADLRESDLLALSPDGLTIPVQTADTIIDRLTLAFPQAVPHNLRAQQTLQVFEAINAHPPGVLATLALLGVYGASFIAAIIFLLVLMLIQ